jgi:Protein of unknown function (DUF3431)
MVVIAKTDTFFIISNYNTDPEQYLQYCNDYHIYDQSPDPKIKAELKGKYSKISFVQNTGHNITDYFRFFIDYYDKLPAWMILAKGNMIGRHVTQEFFERVYANKCYTLLYDDRTWKDNHGTAYQLYDGAFLEINNSWYVPTREHRYFNSYDDLLKFLFKDPIFAKWVLFAPGACYIVSRAQVLKYPKVFYQNLMQILDYIYFPAEAYIVERMLHVIFSGVYELNDYVLDAIEFKQRLEMASLTVAKGKQSKTIIEKMHNIPFILKTRLRNKCLKIANWLN